MILSEALNSAATKNPKAVAILDLGKNTSYRELSSQIAQLSYLYQAEIGHGHRVAILSHNTPTLLKTFFALSNTGNLSVILSPNDSNETILSIVKDLEITHLAVSESQMSRANSLIRENSLALNVIEMEKKKGGEYDTSFLPPPEHPIKDTQAVLVLRTNDFGEPHKYIFFQHKQLHAAATAIRKHYQLSANEKFFTTQSWAHPFALTHSLLLPLFHGLTCAINPDLPSEEQLTYLAEQRINRFVDVPRYYYQLLAACKNAKYTLPGVKSVSVGMGTLPRGLRKTFALLKISVVHCHGRRECFWTLAMESVESPSETDRVKLRPLTGFKYKVLNSEGDEITGDALREGPLAISANTVMQAYFHPDEKMAQAASKQTIRGTWFYTGEVARLEGENDELSITILGKNTDLLQNGAQYTNVDVIDNVLLDLPGVLDAAGFVRIDSSGEKKVACVVVKQNKSLAESQIFAHCTERLKSEECPVTIHFADDIPKDEFGNVNRAALQRNFSV